MIHIFGAGKAHTSGQDKGQSHQVAHDLSRREAQTLSYVSHGLTTHEIAEKLCLSTNTIETHRQRIMRKLNASNIAQAVATGLRRKMIK